jgi:aminoglycoside phosphotransferase (APT) family kinase protein
MSSGAVEELIARVPQWEGLELDVRPLHGGITNRNFVVRASGREFVVRLPGERTELLGIDRANEAEAARRAAELGIGPPVLGDLPQVGTLITAYMPGRHLTDDQFAARLDEVVPLLKRLHDSGPLHGAFPIHRVVEWHARDATAHGVMAPSAYERLHQQSRRIERAFQANPMAPVPCHNDLLPGNVLFGDDADGDGSRVWLLDAEEELLRLYFGTVSHAHLARLALMKVMSEFREGMWAVVQQAISTLDTDFVAYAAERLGNCERLVASPAFEQWLDDAARASDPD